MKNDFFIFPLLIFPLLVEGQGKGKGFRELWLAKASPVGDGFNAPAH
jgi:hypothetical protein